LISIRPGNHLRGEPREAHQRRERRIVGASDAV
jgi:hypothetical protein